MSTSILIFFLSFFVLLLINVPIVFSLVAPATLYLIMENVPLMVVGQRLMAGVDSFPLLAVPLFVLAGNVMNGGGITDRIFDFAQKLVGHLTGGLGYANILASVIFAGMSGSAIADAGGLGAIELKAMKDAGYDEDFSLAITGASSIIGPIIPPSVPAVVYAVVAEESVGRLFIGGVLPGMLMAIALSVLVYIQCRRKNYAVTPFEGASDLWVSFKRAFFPLMTPVIILAGTFSGVFTPTEVASVTVLYALILGFIYRSVTLRSVPMLFIQTARTTIGVMVIVAGAGLFSWVFARAHIPGMISGLFVDMVSSKIIALVVINIFLLIVGMIMDNSAAIPIFVPVLLPIALYFGIDPIHFGIICILNLMIGLLTPPVGLVLYVLSGVSKVPFEKISKAMIPYLLTLIVVLYIITFVPSIVTFLPNMVFGN